MSSSRGSWASLLPTSVCSAMPLPAPSDHGVPLTCSRASGPSTESDACEKTNIVCAAWAGGWVRYTLLTSVLCLPSGGGEDRNNGTCNTALQSMGTSYIASLAKLTRLYIVKDKVSRYSSSKSVYSCIY